MENHLTMNVLYRNTSVSIEGQGRSLHTSIKLNTWPNRNIKENQFAAAEYFTFCLGSSQHQNDVARMRNTNWFPDAECGSDEISL